MNDKLVARKRVPATAGCTRPCAPERPVRAPRLCVLCATTTPASEVEGRMTSLLSWLRHRFSPEPAAAPATAAPSSSGRKRTHANAWLGHEEAADHGGDSAGRGGHAAITGTASGTEEVRVKLVSRYTSSTARFWWGACLCTWFLDPMLIRVLLL